MKTVYGFFAARRYWPDENRLISAYNELKQNLGDNAAAILLTDEKDVSTLAKGDCLVVLPLSGAVQQSIVNAAMRFECTIICAAYIRGNASEKVTTEMLRSMQRPP